ncbi:MAG: serine protease [Candidatus Dormibacteraeota bacterium]|nr:serine protease [Candidatus Dormibacteraeota bacterium]
MDPFARGEGQEEDRSAPAPDGRELDDTRDQEAGSWRSPGDSPSTDATPAGEAGGPVGDQERLAGLGDPPPEWSGYYSYPPPGHRPPPTQDHPGQETPHAPYGAYPPYRPTSFWSPPEPSPRRGRRAALVAVAVVTCVALLVAGVGGGVRAALYFRSLTRPVHPGVHAGTGRAGGGTVDLQRLAARLDPSIVDITGVKQDTTGQTVEEDAGTGVIISRDGEVLTNNHVIEGDDQLQASFANGQQHPITVLGEDPLDDLALVKIQGVSGLPAIRLRGRVAPSMREQVAVLGNALGRGGAPTAAQGQVTNLDQTITATLDSGQARTETLNGLIEMSAQTCPGDSGGMLADGKGNDLGIITAASSSGNGANPGYGGNGGNGGGAGQAQCSDDGFVIPISHAIPIVRQIRAGHRSSRVIIGVPGFLGVSVQECTEASAMQGSCQPPPVAGAQVTHLVQGGAAEQAGFPQSFVITSIGQTQIASPSDLTNALQQTSPGQAVQVTWNDGTGGPTQTTTVTLGAGPPA